VRDLYNSDPGGAVVGDPLPTPFHGYVSPRPPGAEGFDFLLGNWDVRHRKLRERLVDSRDWYEFDGTLAVQPILGGLGNIDENDLQDPEGAYLATSLRLFDAASSTWSIYWIDGRLVGIDTPVRGKFEGAIGHFYAQDMYLERPIMIRFTYENVAPDHARWSQAFSPDEGASWEVNWTMEFTRSSGDPA
jgi:hypothetical protein